ncbi:MAG: MBL fold metallo-hydrolase, partial [Pseudomonadota bacterium]
MSAGRIVVLGCGGSSGVPAPGPKGGNWGAGDPRQPRDRRRRASILIETDQTRVLVDATPDLREQLLDTGADLDAVVFTHAHADHVHGIDDLRAVCVRRRAALDAWAEPAVHALIEQRFGYVFAPIRGDYFYKPTLVRREIDGAFAIGDLTIAPFGQ